MADATKKLTESIGADLHAADPIMSKRTDLFGQLDVFPPNADPKQWPLLSFLFVSEKSDGLNPKGIKLYVKAKYVSQAFERPHFIQDYMLFGHLDLDE